MYYAEGLHSHLGSSTSWLMLSRTHSPVVLSVLLLPVPSSCPNIPADTFISLFPASGYTPPSFPVPLYPPYPCPVLPVPDPLVPLSQAHVIHTETRCFFLCVCQTPVGWRQTEITGESSFFCWHCQRSPWKVRGTATIRHVRNLFCNMNTTVQCHP